MEIAIIALLITVYLVATNIDKRLKLLEEESGPGYSQTISINAWSSIVKYILSNTRLKKQCYVGNGSRKISDEKLRKLLKKYDVEKKSIYIHISYLKNANAYYIRTMDNRSYMISRDGNTNLLYSTRVIGGADSITESDRLELRIYDRIVSDHKSKSYPMLSVCLRFTPKFTFSNKNTKKTKEETKEEIIDLCDLPLFDRDDDTLEKQGYVIDDNVGQPITNDFGKNTMSPSSKTYKINGVEIEFII